MNQLKKKKTNQLIHSKLTQNSFTHSLIHSPVDNNVVDDYKLNLLDLENHEVVSCVYNLRNSWCVVYWMNNNKKSGVQKINKKYIYIYAKKRGMKNKKEIYIDRLISRVMIL